MSKRDSEGGRGGLCICLFCRRDVAFSKLPILVFYVIIYQRSDTGREQNSQASTCIYSCL